MAGVRFISTNPPCAGAWPTTFDGDGKATSVGHGCAPCICDRKHRGWACHFDFRQSWHQPSKCDQHHETTCAASWIHGDWEKSLLLCQAQAAGSMSINRDVLRNCLSYKCQNGKRAVARLRLKAWKFESPKWTVVSSYFFTNSLPKSKLLPRGGNPPAYGPRFERALKFTPAREQRKRPKLIKCVFTAVVFITLPLRFEKVPGLDTSLTCWGVSLRSQAAEGLEVPVGWIGWRLALSAAFPMPKIRPDESLVHLLWQMVSTTVFWCLLG